MDWDDIKKPTAKGFAIGCDLSALSIAELTERISVLQAESARVTAEIEAKRRQAAAAAAFFKS